MRRSLPRRTRATKRPWARFEASDLTLRPRPDTTGSRRPSPWRGSGRYPDLPPPVHRSVERPHAPGFQVCAEHVNVRNVDGQLHPRPGRNGPIPPARPPTVSSTNSVTAAIPAGHGPGPPVSLALTSIAPPSVSMLGRTAHRRDQMPGRHCGTAGLFSFHSRVPAPAGRYWARAAHPLLTHGRCRHV